MLNRGPFRVVVAALLVAAPLALAAPAGAATNKCQKYTAKYNVVAQSRKAVVFETADRIDFGCLYSDGRLRKLPGPDGFEVYTAEAFTLNGRYVAYGLVDQEPAADIYTATVYVVDLKTGKPTVSAQDAYPVDVGDIDFSFDVNAIALTSKGSVAWLADGSINDRESLVVRRQGKKVTVLDRGTDVRVGSLAQSSKGTTFFWTKGSTAKSASLS